MLPVLFSYGVIKVYSMGVLLAIGLFLGLYYWWKLGRDEHWDEIMLFDGFFLALCAFFIFGRLGYVSLHWNELGTVYRIVAFLTYPGLSYAAGILGAIVSTWSYARAKGWEIWKVFDILAVSLTLIMIFGFAGAFLNGSNPGREMPLGLVYPGLEGRRFPTEILGFVWAIFAFGISMRIRKNFRFYAWYKGNSSTAKEGLAAIVTAAMGGVYMIFNALVDDNLLKAGPVPVIAIAGLAVIMWAAITISKRTGRSYKFFKRRDA